MSAAPPPSEEQTALPIGVATERRIGWLTLVFGFLAGVVVSVLGSPDWGIGIVIGTLLAWLNFRWLARGLDALAVESLAQAGSQHPRVPVTTYLLAMFRYVLIALSVCVIFKILKVPLVSMILGLCALGAAAIAASIYEVVRPSRN